MNKGKWYILIKHDCNPVGSRELLFQDETGIVYEKYWLFDNDNPIKIKGDIIFPIGFDEEVFEKFCINNENIKEISESEVFTLML